MLSRGERKQKISSTKTDFSKNTKKNHLLLTFSLSLWHKKTVGKGFDKRNGI